MFLEWEGNSGKLKIISRKIWNSRKFQNHAINNVKQISLSHVIMNINLRKQNGSVILLYIGNSRFIICSTYHCILSLQICVFLFKSFFCCCCQKCPSNLKFLLTIFMQTERFVLNIVPLVFGLWKKWLLSKI